MAIARHRRNLRQYHLRSIAVKSIALLAFGALLPCVYLAGVTGAWIETNWAFLYLTLPIGLLFTRIKMTSVHWAGLALIAWVGLSTLWGPSNYQSIEGILKFSVLILGFILGAECKDPKWLLRGLAIGMTINGILALKQFEGFEGVFQTASPAGLLVNPDTLAETSALVVILLAVENMLYPWALMLWPGLLLTGSRAGWFVLGVFFVVWLWGKSKLLSAILLMIGFAGIIYASFERFTSSNERLFIWLDTISGLTIYGHGIGSFSYLYPSFATHLNTAAGRPVHAHSDILELAFELGFVGLALATVFMVLVYERANQTGKAVLISFVALATISFPLHVPVSAFIFAFMAGLCVNYWGSSEPVLNPSRLLYAKGMADR